MGGEMAGSILACLAEKPMSISEIARSIDEKKYEVSKEIERLEDEGKIKTYKIGRSTACLLRDELVLEDASDEDGRTAEADSPGMDLEMDLPGASDETDSLANDTGPAGTGSAEDIDDTVVPDTDIPGSDTAEHDVEPETGRTAARGVTATDAQSQTRDTPQAGTGRTAPAANGRKDVQQAAEAIHDHDTARGTGPRTIGIVSGKGGVGKTVVTLNLAAALMELGEDVIVIDADTEMSNVSLHLGMYTQSVSLEQVLEDDFPLMSAMYIHTGSGLRVIPASLSASAFSEDHNIADAFEMIPDDYIVLIDSAPGFSEPLDTVIAVCNELLFVTTPELPAVTDTYKLYEEAAARGKTVLGVVVNMYENAKDHLSVKEVEASIEAPVLSVVKKDRTVKRSIFENEPAVTYKPHGKTAHTFKQLAADLTGAQYDPGFVDKLRRYLP